MRKSNWSDLLTAFAMSARDSVRLLFESAMMKARAVISEMKTAGKGVNTTLQHRRNRARTFAGLAEQDRS